MITPVCCYHITYEFQSESTLCSLPKCRGTPCLKQASYLKLSDNNGIRIHNHLVSKRRLNHLANLLVYKLGGWGPLLSINNKLSFIISFQFLSSSLDNLVKHLNKDDFKYLSQEFDKNELDLVKQRGFYPYE